MTFRFGNDFDTGLVQNLGHINIILQLWAQMCRKNLATHRFAKKLEGTLVYATTIVEEQCVTLSLQVSSHLTLTKKCYINKAIKIGSPLVLSLINPGEDNEINPLVGAP